MRKQLRDPMEDLNWHDWFAWRPVVTETSELVWLEVVQRRIHCGWASTRWEYKNK